MILFVMLVYLNERIFSAISKWLPFQPLCSTDGRRNTGGMNVEERVCTSSHRTNCMISILAQLLVEMQNFFKERQLVLLRTGVIIFALLFRSYPLFFFFSTHVYHV